MREWMHKELVSLYPCSVYIRWWCEDVADPSKNVIAVHKNGPIVQAVIGRGR